MKKFILKSFFLLLFLILCTLSFSSRNSYIKDGYNSFEWVNSSKKVKVHGLIIGNSISQTGLKQNTVFKNLSASGTSPISGYYLLRNALQKGGIKTVFVAYPPNFVNTIHRDSFMIWPLLLSPVQTEEVFSLIDYLKDDKSLRVPWWIIKPEYLPIDIRSHYLKSSLSFYHKVLFFRKLNICRRIYYIIKNKYLREKTSNEKIDHSRDKYMEWVDPDYSYTWSQVNIHYLKEIKILCEKYGVRTIYIHMPRSLSEKKSMHFPKQKWFDDYYQILDSIGFEPIPPKINFLHRTLFRDKYGHLNSNGRDVFHEKYLAPALKKAGIKMK